MNLIHDDIKIKYVREGYLPNWPYHLISDSEMCDGFIGKDSEGNDFGFFYDTYPLVDDSIKDIYDTLIQELKYHISLLKDSKDDSYTLPDWVYAFMLGNVVGPKSSQQDIHDLLVMLDVDNIDDIFTALACEACYDVSKSWINKLPDKQKSHRPPTCFGEPHVIKSLRLRASDALPDSDYITS